MKKIVFILVFGMLSVACKQEKPLEEYMTDSWQTTYLKIEMPTVQKSDSTTVIEDTFQNNPDRIAQSRYKEDGTFVAWFLNKERKREGDAPGNWKVEGDSLRIQYFYGGRDVNVSYYIERTEEGFKGTSKYDWDGDGEFDDLLVMKTKRIKSEE